MIRALIILSFPLWGMASLAHAEPRQLYVQPSALIQVVESLREAPAQAHIDFVSLTLEAMVQAYEDELETSGQGRTSDDARARRLGRWQQATAIQLQELHQALQWLAVVRQVRARADRQGQVLLLLDSRPVLVSWPRMSDRHIREARLVERFCTLHPCGETHAEGSPRVTLEAGDVRGSWSFSQDRRPAWESESGVRCEYPDMRDRPVREARCQALTAELESLARVLAQVRREGGRIQWEAIRAQDEPGGGLRVTVNDREDYLLLPPGLLSSRALVWPAAGRWLERRVAGERAAETVWRGDLAD
ncbi:MAG: hypothetical protein ABR558_01870 [Thioalkalivibrio sp.]